VLAISSPASSCWIETWAYDRADAGAASSHLLADVTAIIGSIDVRFGEIDR
jgi:NADH:ubiquinone oxidoreductase subunit D